MGLQLIWLCIAATILAFSLVLLSFKEYNWKWDLSEGWNSFHFFFLFLWTNFQPPCHHLHIPKSNIFHLTIFYMSLRMSSIDLHWLYCLEYYTAQRIRFLLLQQQIAPNMAPEVTHIYYLYSSGVQKSHTDPNRLKSRDQQCCVIFWRL